MLTLLMLATIDFHDQPSFQTHKIKHISFKSMLPTELYAGDLTGTQALPQTSFGVGCVPPQIASELTAFDGTLCLTFHCLMLPHPHPNLPLEGEGATVGIQNGSTV